MPDPNPPVPISAALTRAGTILTVVFDRDLEDGPLDTANWFGVAYSMRFSLDFINAIGDRCVGHPIWGALRPGGPWVNYDPPPYDLKSSAGVPADPIIRFPVQES